MGIMDAIRRIGAKKKFNKEKFSQMQEEDRLQTMLEERKKSSNRRELEKRIHDQEEDEIKSELDKLRKKDQEALWNNHKAMIGSKATILKEGRPILKEKNIFRSGKGKMHLGGSGIFFK